MAKTYYDVSIQWTDTTQPVGYQETIEDIVVTAASVEDARCRARTRRPNVSRVFVDGIRCTSIAFRQ